MSCMYESPGPLLPPHVFVSYWREEGLACVLVEAADTFFFALSVDWFLEHRPVLAIY